MFNGLDEPREVLVLVLNPSLVVLEVLGLVLLVEENGGNYPRNDWRLLVKSPTL